MMVTSRHRIRTRLLLFTFVLLLGQAVAVVGYTLFLARDGLDKEIVSKAEAVARTLRDPIERALDYGIPLRSLRGLDSFFAPVFDQTPDILYLALADASGQVVEASGKAPQWGMLAEEARARTATSGQTSWTKQGNQITVMVPLANGVGSLQVGVDRDAPLQQLGTILTDLGMVVLIGGVLLFELIGFLLAMMVINRLHRLDAMAERVSTGDFGTIAPVSGEDEVGQLARSGNRLVRQVNAAYYLFAGWAEEVRASQLDAAVAQRIQSVIDDIRKHFRSAPQRVVPMAPDDQIPDLRFVLFLLIIAETVLWPLLPVPAFRTFLTHLSSLENGGGAVADGAFLGPALLSPSFLSLLALPVLAAAGLALAGLVGKKRPAPAPRQQTEKGLRWLQIGIGLYALAFLYGPLSEALLDHTPLSAATGADWILVGMRGGAGLGLGLALAGMLSLTRFGEGHRRLGMAVLSGVICGPILGGLFATHLGAESPWFLAAATAVIALLLALSQRQGDRHDPAAAPSSDGNLSDGSAADGTSADGSAGNDPAAPQAAPQAAPAAAERPATASRSVLSSEGEVAALLAGSALAAGLGAVLMVLLPSLVFQVDASTALVSFLEAGRMAMTDLGRWLAAIAMVALAGLILVSLRRGARPGPALPFPPSGTAIILASLLAALALLVALGLVFVLQGSPSVSTLEGPAPQPDRLPLFGVMAMVIMGAALGWMALAWIMGRNVQGESNSLLLAALFLAAAVGGVIGSTVWHSAGLTGLIATVAAAMLLSLLPALALKRLPEKEMGQP